MFFNSYIRDAKENCPRDFVENDIKTVACSSALSCIYIFSLCRKWNLPLGRIFRGFKFPNRISIHVILNFLHWNRVTCSCVFSCSCWGKRTGIEGTLGWYLALPSASGDPVQITPGTTWIGFLIPYWLRWLPLELCSFPPTPKIETSFLVFFPWSYWLYSD